MAVVNCRASLLYGAAIGLGAVAFPHAAAAQAPAEREVPARVIPVPTTKGPQLRPRLPRLQCVLNREEP
jgi:hypothetical protein